MKKLLIFASSLMVLLASCAKEAPQAESSQEDPSKPAGEFISSVTVALEDSTKATLGEPEGESGKMYRKVTWNTGDKICVNGSVSDALGSKYEGQLSAEFTFTEHPLEKSGTYLACYPAGVYKDASHVALPAIQGDAEGANKSVGFPLAGKLTSSDELLHLSLKQLCGFIRVKIQGNSQLDYVEVQTNGEEKVSGDFGIAFDDKGNPTLTTPDGDISAVDKKVKVSCTPTLTSTDQYCVVAVPAQTYGSGLKLSLTTKDNKYYVSNSDKSKTITRAKVTNISNTFDVSKTNYVEISTADQWNSFATNFNNGDYADDVQVNITADLDFTSKSIVVMDKTKDFAGTISGDSHYFKSVQLANDAIVGSLAPAGVIKDVKIDSDSKMTMTSEVGSTTYFAPLVGDLQGAVTNCESAADMDFLVSSSAPFFIGGLAGRIRGGSMKNCKVSGTLKDTETTNIENQYAYIGGLTSDVNQNAAATQKGSISGCEFSGKILMGPTAGTSSGATGITSSSGTGFRIGGIAGRAQNGTVTNCSTTSASAVDVRGDMIQIYVGGIVGNGQVKISECDNAATVSIWSTKTDASGGNAQVGGISGSNSEEVSGCNNTGAINMNAGHRNSFYGGIVGRNTGTVKNCTNSGAITQGTYRPRYMYIGGVLGGNTSTVTDIHNTGDLTVNYVPVNGTMGTTGCGGVIGINSSDINGENKIDNTGTVTININKTCYLNVSAGGIIGINKASLSDVTNKGKVLSTCSSVVSKHEDAKISDFFTAFGGIIGSQQREKDDTKSYTVSNCDNDRDAVPATTEFIYANITSSEASTCLNWCEGGVIGHVYDSNVTIKECTNNAYVRHVANAAATAGRTSFTGGIIGRITTVTYAASVSDCTNYGRCYTNNYNNNTTLATGPFIGGVIGSAEGLSGKTVSISGCSNENPSGAAAMDVCNYALRGTIGGIVGYASYVSLSNSNSSKILSNNANSTYCGGLVGQAFNTSITGGEVSSSPMEKNKNIGGIVGYLGAGSSVSGSKYSGSILTASVKYGAVAAVSVAETTITNAKIASTATVMGNTPTDPVADAYVCYDTNATISGTTIVTD